MINTKQTGQKPKRTILVSSMDPFGSRLLCAVFRSAGYQAILLEESAETLALGLKHTAGGECVPCPLALGGAIKAMRKHGLAAERVSFLMPTASGPCRFGQYSTLCKMVFATQGWQDIRIFSPASDSAYTELGTGTRMLVWHTALVGDILRKLSLRRRPYERTPGDTDDVIERHTKKMEAALENADTKGMAEILAKAVNAIGNIPVRDEKRPLVGVVGEIYVRCNPFINDNVCRRIEELGGEAWLAPISEWLFYTNYLKSKMLAETRGFQARCRALQMHAERRLFFEKWEHRYYGIAGKALCNRREHPIADVVAAGAEHVPWQFEGESILTLGRAMLFIKRDGARAIVNASPAFCMPGTITASIFPQIERETGIPVLNIFYDGSGNPNQALVPVMHYLSG